MTRKFLLLVWLLAPFFQAVAQDDHEHDHDHHSAHEIGFSLSPVYFAKADEFSVATHIHYTYMFPESKFGVGLGYERIFDEHKHNFVGLELSYRLIHPLSFSLSPGLTFEGEHPEEKAFAMHFETVYEFEIGALHVGPVLEMAWHSEDYHISAGVHVGLGF